MKTRSGCSRWAIVARAFACALVLCGLVLPAAGSAKSSSQISAKTSNLPAAATSAISAVMGRDQQAYHAAVVNKGYQMKNPRSGLQATFTRQGVRVESGKASWGMALAAFGASGKLQPVPRAKPQANQNRVEYRRGALTEWYVNGPAGLEQGFTIAKAPAGSANGTLELALRLTGNMTASVDAAKTGLVLKSEQAELRYTGLAARDAKRRKLRSWLDVQNGRLLVHVAAAGATYPLVVDPYIYTQVALTASDGASPDLLGNSVSVSADGSTVVASAPSNNSNRGAAYVFTNPGSGWTEAARLMALDGQANDWLGNSVSVSTDGSTVVAGAPRVNNSQGAAYVFVKPSGGWAAASTPQHEAAKLVASDGIPGGDALGNSVSVSADGSTVVAGAIAAPYNVNTDDFGPGAAYVFVKPSGGWAGASTPQQEAAELKASDGQPYDYLGESVSVSADGSTVVASAPSYGTTGADFVFSDAVPFDSFDASKLRIPLGPPSGFALSSMFTLGTYPNGNTSVIDPLTEPVMIIVGNLVMAIPAGSFHQQKNGDYVFSGIVEGVSLNAKFEDMGANAWTFKANGSNQSQR